MSDVDRRAPGRVRASAAADLLDAAQERRDVLVEDVTALVRMESPSDDVAHLVAIAEHLATEWQRRGATVHRHHDPAAGTHLEIRWPGPPGTPDDVPPALVIGHLDTVHPLGALERNPIRLDGTRLWGPGTQDMKSGLVATAHAVDLLAAGGTRLPRPVTVLLTADEEVGSLSSRALIETLARESEHALVLEGAAVDGSLKTGRKGVGLFEVTVHGRAAHAGVHFEDGVNAAVGLAALIGEITELTDLARGTTVNVGVVRAGTVSNVVPSRGSAKIDLRFLDDEEAQRVAAALRSLSAPIGRTEISGGVNRPAMVRTAGIAELFRRARAAGGGLGLKLTETTVGGASDGNIAAAVGTPVLDGLGPLGAGLHTDGEWVDVDSLVERTALLAVLLTEL